MSKQKYEELRDQLANEWQSASQRNIDQRREFVAGWVDMVIRHREAREISSLYWTKLIAQLAGLENRSFESFINRLIREHGGANESEESH